MYLIFIIRKMKLLWLKKENRVIKGDAVKELLAMGMPTGLQFSITVIGSMVMQSANNGLLWCIRKSTRMLTTDNMKK